MGKVGGEGGRGAGEEGAGEGEAVGRKGVPSRFQQKAKKFMIFCIFPVGQVSSHIYMCIGFQRGCCGGEECAQPFSAEGQKNHDFLHFPVGQESSHIYIYV